MGKKIKVKKRFRKNAENKRKHRKMVAKNTELVKAIERAYEEDRKKSSETINAIAV